MVTTKIAFILLTNGLEYDDRVRKEIRSIQTVIDDVEIKIFGFHWDNREESGVLSYGIPYQLVPLRLRGGKKDAFHLALKEYSMYRQMKILTKDFDILWIINDQFVLFPILSDKKIVYDMHEVPVLVTGSKIKNAFFHQVEKNCPVFIHANEQRIEYLRNKGIIKDVEKHLVLHNYSDREWISHKDDKASSYRKFEEWLSGNEYIYIQGINTQKRYPMETLSAVMETKRMRAVVIGRVEDGVMKELEAKYPDLHEWIYFTGQIVQSETASFIANCSFSIVFYTTDSPNNKYCEPNRMFQSLALGRPVLVGNNPPMKEIVEKLRCGVVLNSDGRNVDDNINGINKMIDKYEEYQSEAEKTSSTFTWEEQNEVIRRALS